MGRSPMAFTQPAPWWVPGSCGHEHPEDGDLGRWPDDQRGWPRLWTVAQPTPAQEATRGGGDLATLEPGTTLRLDATHVQIDATSFGGEVHVSHRFGVVGGKLDGCCFYLWDRDCEGIPVTTSFASRLPTLRPTDAGA